MNFLNGTQLLDICQTHNKAIWEVMLEREIEVSERSESVILDDINKALDVMFTSIEKGIDNERRSLGGLLGGDAKRLHSAVLEGSSYYLPADCIKLASYSIAVMEVNSLMGIIVAAPTAGSSGVLPAVLKYAKEKFDFTDNQLAQGFLTAAAIGYIVTHNATVAGAEGGCQAEIGTATAMSAAALTHMKGGNVQACIDAASFAFKNIMGLVCDPIAGLVESPCAKRNALGGLNALLSSDFALFGMKSVIPFDEVVEAMYQVGKAMPESLRETAKGGIAACPSAKRIEKSIFGE